MALKGLVIGLAITKLCGCLTATRQCEDDSRVDDGMGNMLCCLPILKVSGKSASLGNWIFGYFWNWRIDCCTFYPSTKHTRDDILIVLGILDPCRYPRGYSEGFPSFIFFLQVFFY